MEYLLHPSTWSFWTWIYVSPGVLCYIGVLLHNIAVTFKNPPAAFKTVGLAVIDLHIIFLWPIWAIVGLIKAYLKS